MVKVMKAKAVSKKGTMTKTAVFESLASKSGVAKKQCKAVIGALQELVPEALKSSGKITIPGLTMIKLRLKPARKAGTKMAFGKQIKVKAAPAKKVVKAFAVKVLKDCF